MEIYSLSRIARKQRQFILLFGGMYALSLILRLSLQPIRRAGNVNLELLANLANLAMSVTILTITIIVLIQLMAALDYGVPMRILFGFLMIIPLINLVVLLAVNGRATRTLQDAGVKVGLLGASPASIAELENYEAGPPRIRSS